MNEAHAHVLIFICLSALGPACKRALEGILERERGPLTHEETAIASAKLSFTIAILCISGGGCECYLSPSHSHAHKLLRNSHKLILYRSHGVQLSTGLR